MHLPNVFSKSQQRLALNQLQPTCASILACCTMQTSALTACTSQYISASTREIEEASVSTCQQATY